MLKLFFRVNERLFGAFPGVNFCKLADYPLSG
ncbi:MAG: hypothetical protein KatS3mg105_2464 [Gemmatales bacterium]|nr:MAG: hypothetical protein KatS3mg105_2464 [Gemmatales bacterium]